MLSRPAWQTTGAPDVENDVHAAKVVATRGYTRVFLTTGRSGVAAFRDSGAWFLIRVVTPPIRASRPRRHEVTSSPRPIPLRGRTRPDGEHGIDALVTKNSGEMTARNSKRHMIGIDVIMIHGGRRCRPG